MKLKTVYSKWWECDLIWYGSIALWKLYRKLIWSNSMRADGGWLIPWKCTVHFLRFDLDSSIYSYPKVKEVCQVLSTRMFRKEFNKKDISLFLKRKSIKMENARQIHYRCVWPLGHDSRRPCWWCWLWFSSGCVVTDRYLDFCRETNQAPNWARVDSATVNSLRQNNNRKERR